MSKDRYYEESDRSDKECSDESEEIITPAAKKLKATPKKGLVEEAQVQVTATYLICMHDFCWQAYLGKASLCGATRFCM